MEEAMTQDKRKSFEDFNVDKTLDYITNCLDKFTTSKDTLKFCARTSLYCAALYTTIGYSHQVLAALVLTDLVVGKLVKQFKICHSHVGGNPSVSLN